MKIFTRSPTLPVLLMGATLSLISGVKSEPPELAKLDVPALNRIGVPVIDLKEDRIFPLSNEPRPEKFLVKLSWINKIREECIIYGYRWNGAAFEKFGSVECGLGPDDLALSLSGDTNAPKDSNGELLFPDKTVIMIEDCGAHPPGFTDYYLVEENTIRKVLTVHENEGIIRSDWDGDGTPDFTKNGSYFACGRLQPAYMHDFTSYLIFDRKISGWIEMETLMPPDSSDEDILDVFRMAEKRSMVQDRQGALAALRTLQLRLTKDVNIRRDIKFVELMLPECEKPGKPAPQDSSLRDQPDGWAGYAIEGAHDPILNHLRSLPIKKLFSKDLAKTMFSDEEPQDDYLDCALEKLRRSPDGNYCKERNAGAWFLSGWADHQSGQPIAEILPNLMKAVERAPSDAFYRRALAEYKRITAEPGSLKP